MSYTPKETKILIDYHRRYSSLDDREECLECGQGIPHGVICDDCRYRERDAIELLADWILSMKSAAAGTRPDMEGLRLAARCWWEGYCRGAEIEWEEREEGYKLIKSSMQ